MTRIADPLNERLNGGSPPPPDVQEFVDAGTALAAVSRAEIDVQISTAKRYPRNLSTFKKRALEMATLDQETAESCFYTLPRDGKSIKGPSARLAEIVASAWGNIRAAARIVAIDDNFVTSQAVCHDLETNTCISIENKRRITNKTGKRFTDDMIAVTSNASNSIAFRNAVFKIVPKAYVQPIYEICKKMAIGDATTLVDRRHRAMEAFGKMGVTPDRVLAALGKAGIEDVGLDDLETLTGLRTAIKEGDTSIDDAFPVAGARTGKVDPINAKMGAGDAPQNDQARQLRELAEQEQRGTPGAGSAPAADGPAQPGETTGGGPPPPSPAAAGPAAKPDSQIDPEEAAKEAWEKFTAGLLDLANGDPDYEADIRRGLQAFCLKRGIVGQGWKSKPEDRLPLIAGVKDRSGLFVNVKEKRK